MRNDMWPNDNTKPRATINLGFAHSFPKVAFWEKCFEECIHYWTEGGGGHFKWKAIPQTEVRQQKHWKAHQVIVQTLAQCYGPSVVVVHEPLVAFPLCRWEVVHGVVEISTHSYVVNVFTDIWSDSIIDTVVTALKQQVSRDASRERNNRNAIGQMLARDGVRVLANCGMPFFDCVCGISAAQSVIQKTPDLAFAWDMDTDAGFQKATTCLAAILTQGLEQLAHLDWPIGRMTATLEHLRRVLGMRANSTEVHDFITEVNGNGIKAVE